MNGVRLGETGDGVKEGLYRVAAGQSLCQGILTLGGE